MCANWSRTGGFWGTETFDRRAMKSTAKRPSSLGTYFQTVLAVWIVAIAAGLIYARQIQVPDSVTVAVLPALLIELALYIGAGFESFRARLRSAGALAAPILL